MDICRLTTICAVLLLPRIATAQPALPYADAPFRGKITADRAQSVPDWPRAVQAPRGAPNIVLILLDDVGFGASGTFGGPATTPELDKLAAGGVRYNDFNTAAICSPSRASLLTGRNPHQVGFGNLQDVPAGFPGYSTVWPKSTASIAEILRDNGYSTAAFGKWHNTPIWEISPAGPFDHWPTGLGFDYFYGFMGGESSEWEPRLFRGTVPVEPPGGFLHGYHLTTDLVDDALHWVREHAAVAPDKPYFLYFATGATHAPHHVPKPWIDKYRGQFDQGWDALRQQTFARQKARGVIPATAELTPRPKELPSWDSLSADQKRLCARQMEVYAGFLSQTDDEVGRFLRGLHDAAPGADTLVFYIVGDNGGSAEGGLEGTDAATALTDGQKNDLTSELRHIDDLGGPYFDNHYAAGWSWATSAPFQWMKQIASHFGGTRDGLVISWPGHTAQPASVRGQFAHVNDIAPTIYAAAHVAFPAVVNDTQQVPLEGHSLLATLTDPAAQTGHNEQYFEIFGNRAIYKDGWVAAARRYAPWEIFQNPIKIFTPNFAQDRWELYHVETDYSEAHDLAAQEPARLAALKAEFDKEAARNGVFPMVPLPIFGAPSPRTGRDHFVYAEGVDRVPPDMVPDLTGRAHQLTATIVVPPAGADGVIVAEGGRFGGFSLFVKDGKLIYDNNTLGKTHDRIVSDNALPAGQVQIVFEFAPDDQLSNMLAMVNRRPPGGTGRLLINGRQVGTAHFAQFGDFTDAINETLDVGDDTGSPVSPDYMSPNPYGGRVERVTIDLM